MDTATKREVALWVLGFSTGVLCSSLIDAGHALAGIITSPILTILCLVAVDGFFPRHIALKKED